MLLRLKTKMNLRKVNKCLSCGKPLSEHMMLQDGSIVCSDEKEDDN